MAWGLLGSVKSWVIKMKISILCSDFNHPVVSSLQTWVNDMKSKEHEVGIVFDKRELSGGDILFLVSCNEIIRDYEREKYKVTLVLHASDLPKGRGWSPYIWSVLNGCDKITVSMIEASDPVDSGDIWLKKTFFLDGHELLPEINKKLFNTQISLMTKAVEQFNSIIPVQQKGDPGPYLTRRTPANSRLDPYKSIAEQFNLLRVVDSERYPAFFDFHGKRYLIKIEKMKNEK